MTPTQNEHSDLLVITESPPPLPPDRELHERATNRHTSDSHKAVDYLLVGIITGSVVAMVFGAVFQSVLALLLAIWLLLFVLVLEHFSNARR